MTQDKRTLPIQQLQPNPFQPRSRINPKDLEELTQSIQTYGILEPLVIAHTPAGYQIIAGERRWRAAKKAGLEEVPVYVKKTSPRGMLEMALVENVQRVDLSPIERGQAFQQLIRDFSFTTGELAKKVGKSPSYISNSLKLLRLPDAIADGLLGKQITEGHARALMGIADEASMIECYKILLKENASVRRAEELARRYQEKLKDKQLDGEKRTYQLKDKELASIQKKFQPRFHSKIKLKISRSHRQTRFSIWFKGNPEKTQADLEKILKLMDKTS